jgi:hypothetical protein
MVLTMGRITDKDLNYGSKDGWKKLAPQEYALGARAAAVVVHARNPVDSLTMDQLQSVFSGKAAEWKVFGGESKPIRRYGLPQTDPLSVLFHDKVLPVVRCNMLTRKQDSAEVLAALASDPQAIGFVDAVAASAMGGTVKIVGIGDGKSAILPNAQTIKDGSYGLSQALTLYVSAKSSAAAQEFTEFILAGHGDAVCRRHGFMPTLRVVRADALAAFEKLYGADIKRVKASPDPSAAIGLAEQILASARTAKLSDDLVVTMCEAAFDLAFNASGGETVAFEVLRFLADKCPDVKFDCAIKQAALCERAYKADKLRANGERLIDALTAAGDLGTSAHRFAESADAWSRALAAAEQVNSTRTSAIKDRLPAFVARKDTVKQVADMTAQLRISPQDATLRGKMLQTYLVDLDSPADAAKFLDATEDETLKTNIPLAAGPADKLSEDALLTLGEWYAGLVEKAGVGGKELITARAQSYYVRFFAMHKDRDDALAMRATLGIQKVGGKVPEAVVAATPGAKPVPPKPAVVAAEVAQDWTDLTLAEFVAGNREITGLGRQQIKTAQQITDLRPLVKLTKLTALELVQAENLKDLSLVGKLTGLTSLTLTGLEAPSLSGLSTLPNLTALDLSGSKNIGDLSPLGRLTGIRTLNLTGCSKVANLTPLSQLTALTSLSLANCESLTDVRPLEKLARNLNSLSLNGCVKLTDVTPLSKLTKLKALDVQNCGVSDDDLAWLHQHLPDCKITPAPPKPATK